MIWHSNTITDVLQELQVDPTVGLSTQEADARLKEYGKNCIQEQKNIGFHQAFSKQLQSPPMLILLIASAVVLVISVYRQFLRGDSSDWLQPIAVVGWMFGIAVLGALRQCRAYAKLRDLRTLSAPDTRVLRDNKEQVCSAHVLVPGDILHLNVGDLAPADCRLITSYQLQCDESVLTESDIPVDKDATTIFADITPLAQRTNMLYAGTAIISGTATAVVVATGIRSEMGRIGDRSAYTSFPLQKQTDRLHLYLNIFAVAVGLLYLILGLIRKTDLAVLVLTLLSLWVALVPKNLTALLAHLTVRGIERMMAHPLRLCHSEAAHALGQVDTVCVDQEMLHHGDSVQLCSAYVGHRSVNLTEAEYTAPGLTQLLRLAALGATNNTPTDNAILCYLPRVGINKTELMDDMPRIGELPITDRRSTTVHLAGDQALILVVGEWRSLLPLCVKGNPEELTAAATAMERDGLQVIAVTYRLSESAPSVYTPEELEHSLTCIGLLGLRASLRNEVKQVTVTSSPVHTILFSNEPESVAAAIAQGAGLTDDPHTINNETIDQLSDEELETQVEHFNVYCKLSATQKLRVLSALQKRGHKVAVTGCHSDEADLLTQAYIGIARGLCATDIAKDAADIILTDDSYTTIVAAIDEGGRICNERKGLIGYLLFCLCAILVIGFSGLYGWISLRHTAAILLIVHCILLALPTPQWITLGVSHCIHQYRERK